MPDIEVTDLCTERRLLSYTHKGAKVTLVCTLEAGHDDDFHYDPIENLWWHDGGPQQVPGG